MTNLTNLTNLLTNLLTKATEDKAMATKLNEDKATITVHVKGSDDETSEIELEIEVNRSEYKAWRIATLINDWSCNKAFGFIITTKYAIQQAIEEVEDNTDFTVFTAYYNEMFLTTSEL